MTTTYPFRARLMQGGTLLADGSTATLLSRHDLPPGGCYEAANLTHPEAVLAVHRAYAQAGAEIIEANTFGANPLRLADYGLVDQTAAINAAGIALARRAAAEVSARQVYAAGAIGPLGKLPAPLGRLSQAQAREAFSAQAAAQVEAGADLIILETFSYVPELALAVEAVRAISADIPLVAQLSFTRDDVLPYGGTLEEAAEALDALAVDVIGVNCSHGAAQVARLSGALQQMLPGRRLSALPNAGWPEYVSGRVLYPAQPAYFADYAAAFGQAGIALTGGCCGTTPAHIEAMRAALDDPAYETPVRISPRPAISEAGTTHAEPPSELARKLRRGDFVVAVEVTPPKGIATQEVLQAAFMLQAAGADALDISDSPMARMRMSPWAVCALLQEAAGLDTVLHFPTRGRNLLRIQGDLLAAHALGIRNLFVVMGDPTKIGDYPDAHDNFDISPSNLAGLVKHNFNAGKDWAGSPIGQPTNFLVSCALNLDAADMDKEFQVLEKKLENGADYLLTQPIYDPAIYTRFMDAYAGRYGRPLGVPVLVGLLPIMSLRHANFLNNEVPGISIPQAVLERIKAAGDAAAAEGVHISQEIGAALRQAGAAGLYVIPQFGRYDLAAQIVEAVKEPALSSR